MDETKVNYMLSFLMILVDRNGGTLKIENLKEYNDKHFDLGMKLDEDSVVLTAKKVPRPGY